ncbi:MAG: RebB family R body protein [Flavobacteriaceae bacterium]|nr:RebB family R body protein [Flavobacteriaceae bacterium]
MNIAEETKQTKSAINDQIADSIITIQELFKKHSGGDLNIMAHQVMTQATGMAMLNLVNQQQQLYTLQNTVTTVAVKAMLASNPEDAVKLMNETVKNNNFAENYKEIKILMDELSKSYSEIRENELKNDIK